MRVDVVQGENGTDSESDEDGVFLGTIGESSRDLWRTKARVKGTFMEFQIDTGAEVSVISKRDFNKLGKTTLLPSQKTFRGPNQHPLLVIGQLKEKSG